ncbi:MAG: DMT family transporter [Ilumatobacteraceae bacterium]
MQLPTGQVAGRSGVVAMVVAALFWSIGGVLGKSTHASGVVLSFWRMWIASGVLVVIAIVAKRWPSRADFRHAGLAGVLFGLNICVFFISIQSLAIATALIIAALAPVVALPVSVMLMGERLTAIKVVCAAASVVGVVVAILVAPATESGSSSQTIGYLWALLALVFWVGYLLVSKGVRRNVETVRFMFVVSLIGAITVSFLVVITSADLGEIHGAGWAWVSILAIGPGIAGHGLVAWAQPRVDASVTSVLIQAEPVGATAFAWMILGEHVSLAQGLAMAGVVAALCVLAYSESRDGGIEIVDGVG